MNPSTACLPLIFLHMFKAGGTSVRRYIRAQYPSAAVKEVEGSIADLQEWRQQDSEARFKVDLLVGHQYFGNHDYLRSGATYLTVLREPIDRVVSFYYYVLRMPNHYLYNYGFSSGMSLRQMYENTNCIELDNLQVRMLNPQPDSPLPFGSITPDMLETARTNLKYIFEHGYVGIVEEMERFTGLLEAELGWDPAKMTRSNQTASRPSVDTYDEETLDIVRQSNALDAELYEYARELFASRCAD